MAIREGFVMVQRELFDCMRRHCESCCGFNAPLQDLSGGYVVIPTESSPNSKKRNAAHLFQRPAGSRQGPTEISRPSQQQQPGSELSGESGLEPLQQYGSGPSSQSRLEPSQSGPGPSLRSGPHAKKKRAKTSRKDLAVNRFVRNTPTGTEWRRKQTELGLCTVEEYEHVVQRFTREAHVGSKWEPSKEPGESENELIVVGKNLAILTKSSLENASLQRSFAYHQVLILLSYCEILRKKGVSYEAIDELIHTIIDIRERDRKALLDTVLWINRLIVELVRKGWTLHRATELFFINAISISDLIWIRSDKTFETILNDLSTDAFVKYNYSDCLTPSYTIPALIASLLDSTAHQISLIEIYATLGYDLPDLPTSVEAIFKVRPARGSLIRRVTSEFEVSTRNSFVPAANCPAHEESENWDIIIGAEHSLSALICAFGTIPKFMLERAVSPQSRWDGYGVECRIDPQNARFGTHLKNLFLDSVIGSERLDGVENYICGSASAEYQYSQQKSYWIEQSLWLFCYIFPRNPTALSVSEKERLFAVLEHLLRRYAETGMEIPSDDEVIETLLAVSKFGPLTRRRLILSLVDRRLSNTASAYLQAEFVYQRSVVLRLKGDIDGSNRLLREFLNRSDMALHLEATSILGLLHLSQATNHAYKFDFKLADSEAQKWIPHLSNVTEKQLDVVWNQIHSAGRILRGKGHFVTACQFFESCLEMQPLREPKRLLALSHLADTYIEVDYLQSRETNLVVGELLDKAENLVRPEIERLRFHAPRSKGFRRLLLSMSEIQIKRTQFDQAECLLMELCEIYGRLADPDIVDRLGHVRAYIALARISPPSESETRWIKALNLGRRYNPLEEEVFTVALIHLFICTARLTQGDMEGGKAAFDYAEEICRIKPPQFLIPGVACQNMGDEREITDILNDGKFQKIEGYDGRDLKMIYLDDNGKRASRSISLEEKDMIVSHLINSGGAKKKIKQDNITAGGCR